MTTMMLRATVKDEALDEVESAVRDVFDAIERERPAGVRYASSRVEGTNDFVIVLQLAEDGPNPLRSIPEFLRFEERLGSWLASPPTPEHLRVVGSYGLF